MGDDDKPFACTAPGCGMRFTNEDHLTVHKKKHEMSLNLSTANSIKNNLFVGSFCDSDQTPTPTRFIRNCEEVGLFQDLQNVNPFEEQFRKAVEAVKSGAAAIPESLNGNSDPDVLNTPSVLPNMLESDLVVSTTTTTESGEIQPMPRTLSSQIPSSSVQPSSTTTDSDDEITIVSTSVSVVQPPSSSNTNTTSSNFLPSQTRVIRCGQSNEKPLVTQSPVISTATSSAGQVVQIPTVASTGDIPLTMSLPTTSVTQPTSVITSATAVVQLLLKLPDGRSIPVQIPAVPVVPTTVTSTPKTTSSVTNSSVTSLAKMKLKQALTQNQQNSHVGSGSNNNSTTTTTNNNMRQMLEAVDMVTNQQMKTEAKEIPSSPDSKCPVFSKRRRTSEEDPDEKRRRFLERNRAAATRCRLKRKQWIQSLERKADELTSTNQQLQGEVQLLRNEVAKLKTMLLAHKDCPVTLQQRALGQIDGSQQNAIVVDEITTIQITSAEAIASSALTNMAHHTATSEPTHVLPVDVIIESDPMDLVNHIQENSNNDIDK